MLESLDTRLMGEFLSHFNEYIDLRAGLGIFSSLAQAVKTRINELSLTTAVFHCLVDQVVIIPHQSNIHPLCQLAINMTPSSRVRCLGQATVQGLAAVGQNLFFKSK